MKRLIIVLALLLAVAVPVAWGAWQIYFSPLPEILPGLIVENIPEVTPEETEQALERWLPEIADRTGSGGAGSGSVEPNPVSPESVTVETVVRQYMPQVLQLERRYEARLNAVLQAARQEYKSEPGNAASLATKYLRVSRALEAECDAEFHAFLDRMEGELKTQGLSTVVVENARAEYKERKKERRESLLEKVKGIL